MPLKKRRKAAAAAADDGEEEVAPKKKKLSESAVQEAPPRPMKKKGKEAAEEEQAAVAEPETKSKAKSGKRLKQARKAAARAEAADDAEQEADSAGDAKSGGEGSKKQQAAGAKAEIAVFVSGLPYKWNVDKLKAFFQKCGEVVEVRAPTWQDSGRLRGYAHVVFAERKAQKEALSMSGTKVDSKGRYLQIEVPKPVEDRAAPHVSPEDVVGKKRLFVKSLPYDATEAEIKDLFVPFGAVVDIRVPTSFGRCKGFAYVEFKRPDSLAKAIAAGAELRGRKLFLDADAGKGPKAGFHYRASAYEQDGVTHRAGQPGRGGRGAGSGRGGGAHGPTSGRGRKST